MELCSKSPWEENFTCNWENSSSADVHQVLLEFTEVQWDWCTSWVHVVVLPYQARNAKKLWLLTSSLRWRLPSVTASSEPETFAALWCLYDRWKVDILCWTVSPGPGICFMNRTGSYEYSCEGPVNVQVTFWSWPCLRLFGSSAFWLAASGKGLEKDQKCKNQTIFYETT
jgi:hypothetical protein